MKFITPKGHEVACEVSPHRYPLRSRESSRSNAQFHLGQQLQALYAGIPILEEFSIPDSKLSLDFFIPVFRVAFEFQGEQHDQFNSFYHKDKTDFIKQQQRDVDKREWCEINSIRLIEVRDPEISLDDLKRLINV